MYEFLLYTYNASGTEITTTWKVLPIDVEPLYQIIADDKLRATGSSSNRPFAIKEVWNLTFGAGTLGNDGNRKNFLKMYLAHKIIWRRKTANATIDTEFEIVRDQETSFDYLESKRSLKKKTVKIVEKEPNYFPDFEDFLAQYLILISANALW